MLQNSDCDSSDSSESSDLKNFFHNQTLKKIIKKKLYNKKNSPKKT